MARAMLETSRFAMLAQVTGRFPLYQLWNRQVHLMFRLAENNWFDSV